MIRDAVIALLILFIGLATIIGMVITSTPGIVLVFGITLVILLAWIFKL